MLFHCLFQIHGRVVTYVDHGPEENDQHAALRSLWEIRIVRASWLDSISGGCGFFSCNRVDMRTFAYEWCLWF